MKVTKEQIKHLANLAKLEFSEEELEKFRKEFNRIIEYVSKINQCEVDGIEIEHNLSGYKDQVLQEDNPIDYGITREQYLRNATNRTRNGMIVVRNS
ncbi:MAG: hypothetical protein Kow0081_3660 [Candidatus Dojkabacteria bacterium]